MATHGTALDSVIAPRSQFYHGPFGRMFRNLAPHDPPGQTEAEKRQFLLDLADTMIATPQEAADPALDNPKIPAGYTYLGQFIDHDITFDPTSSLQRRSDPNRLRNFRTPRFDLDSVYGGGPDQSPYLYDQSDPPKLLVGKGENSPAEDDLPRNSPLNPTTGQPAGDRRALIGDPRNDENIIVSQLQLAFIKFHNRVVEDVRTNTNLSGNALFEEVQRIVRWHYQWVVIHDFLKRLVGTAPDGSNLVDKILPAQDDCPRKFRLCFYRFRAQPFMPVEFSVAAYRLGHSMVRPAYDLNTTVTEVPIFVPDPNAGPLDDLRGFRILPPLWTIQWDRFLVINGSQPQLSRKIDTKASPGLATLPPTIVSDPPASLPARNLLRGWRMELPSGQSVAKAMGIPPLDTGSDPLWFYILQEAENAGGQHLGPVGARIVAEVLIGLAAGDPSCFLNVEPRWKPTLPGESCDFQLRDILSFAGV